jgi:hypothetical protein
MVMEGITNGACGAANFSMRSHAGYRPPGLAGLVFFRRFDVINSSDGSDDPNRHLLNLATHLKVGLSIGIGIDIPNFIALFGKAQSPGVP